MTSHHQMQIKAQIPHRFRPFEENIPEAILSE